MKKNIIVIIAIAAMCIVGMFIFKNEISNSLTNHITDKAMHETFKTNDIREIVRTELLKREGVKEVTYATDEDGNYIFYIDTEDFGIIVETMDSNGNLVSVEL